MKKQFLILATTVSMVAFISCSKEKTEMQQSPQTSTEEISSSNSSSARMVFDSLNLNLEGRFEFDDNLKDKMRKLPDGFSTSRIGAKYTTDRKGKSDKALLLDGYYGIKLSNVPQQTHTSISVWLNIPDRTDYIYNKAIVSISGNVSANGPSFYDTFQDQIGGHLHEISGGVITGYDSVQHMNLGTFTGAPFPEPGWHHYVITYDGTFFNYYFDGDGNFIKYKIFPASIASGLQNYMLGFADLQDALSHGFWKGSMDDLRFYSRTLTDNDVKRLYKQ
jgi:hypothetical protein